jgi:hypothetical protein
LKAVGATMRVGSLSHSVSETKRQSPHDETADTEISEGEMVEDEIAER